MLVNFINLINFCLVDSTHYSDLRGKLESSSCLNEGCYLLTYLSHIFINCTNDESN